MKTILQYLDDLKEISGSDYKTAKMLEISREAVSQIRKRGTAADDTAIKMAAALEKDTSELLLAAAIARSEGNTKIEWEKISKRMGIAAGIILAVNTALPSVEAHYEGKTNAQGMYIMLNSLL